MRVKAYEVIDESGSLVCENKSHIEARCSIHRKFREDGSICRVRIKTENSDDKINGMILTRKF